MFWFGVVLFLLMLASFGNAPIRFMLVLISATWGGFSWWGVVGTDGEAFTFWGPFIGFGILAAFILQPIFWACFGGGFYIGKNGFKLPWN